MNEQFLIRYFENFSDAMEVNQWRPGNTGCIMESSLEAILLPMMVANHIHSHHVNITQIKRIISHAITIFIQLPNVKRLAYLHIMINLICRTSFMVMISLAFRFKIYNPRTYYFDHDPFQSAGLSMSSSIMKSEWCQVLTSKFSNGSLILKASGLIKSKMAPLEETVNECLSPLLFLINFY